MPRRARATLAITTICALGACDDPLRVREVPVTSSVGLFMIVEPMRGVQALLVQESPKLPEEVLLGVVDTAGVTIAQGTSNNPEIDLSRKCVLRYGYGFGPGSLWLPRCIPLTFVPEFGRTYRVTASGPGRRTASAITTVPGDFEIVTGTVEGDPPRHVTATWTRSAGVHRYVVAVAGHDVNPCAASVDRCPRWFAVTEDTTISAAIDAKYVEGVAGPYPVAVYAMNRELFEHFMTGATSGYFPIAPAQNVAGGYGAVGAWVRRAVVPVLGLTLQRLTTGLRVSNVSSAEMRFGAWSNDSFGPYPICEPGSPPCTPVTPGQTLFIPWEQVLGYTPKTEMVQVRVCPPDKFLDADCRYGQLWF